VDFGNQSYWTHRCELPQPTTHAMTTKDELLKLYREMFTVRRAEVACDNLYKEKAIRGFLHLYNGQEAITSGYGAAITKEDHVITAYRCHGHFLERGGSLFELFSELMMKSTGCSKGKGGSMHLYRDKGHFHGGNGIVGAQCSVGAGIAFALKYNKTNNVCLTFYGDGAANQGQLFEAFNMASLWKIPVIFICENNKYGMGTSAARSSAVTDYYTRGDFVPGLKIDAMNVLAVRDGVKYAANWCRSGKGPIVIEMETYRYMGHSMSDPGLTYRTRDEVNLIKSERDPIEKVGLWLQESKLATEEEIKNIEKEVRNEVDAAVKQAREAPFPEPHELYTDVHSSFPYFTRTVELPNAVAVTAPGAVQPAFSH